MKFKSMNRQNFSKWKNCKILGCVVKEYQNTNKYKHFYSQNTILYNCITIIYNTLIFNSLWNSSFLYK